MSDCAPYSISVLTGNDFQDVLEEARKFGWVETKGMLFVACLGLAKKCGLHLLFEIITKSGKKPTLGQFLKLRDGNSSYLLNLNEHVIAVKDGIVFDLAETHARAVIHDIYRVVEVDDLTALTVNDDERTQLNCEMKGTERHLLLSGNTIVLADINLWAIDRLAQIRSLY